MPAPPPNGVSSTFRCRSGRVGADIVRVEPPSRAERTPRQRMPERAGKHLRKQRQNGRAPGHRGSPPPLAPACRRVAEGASTRSPCSPRAHRSRRAARRSCGPPRDRPPAPPPRERHEVRADLQARAAAIIMHRVDRPERRAVRVDDRQPDEVGEVELLVVGWRQAARGRHRDACSSASPPPCDRRPCGAARHRA